MRMGRREPGSFISKWLRGDFLWHWLIVIWFMSVCFLNIDPGTGGVTHTQPQRPESLQEKSQSWLPIPTQCHPALWNPRSAEGSASLISTNDAEGLEDSAYLICLIFGHIHCMRSRGSGTFWSCFNWNFMLWLGDSGFGWEWSKSSLGTNSGNLIEALPEEITVPSKRWE